MTAPGLYLDLFLDLYSWGAGFEVGCEPGVGYYFFAVQVGPLRIGLSVERPSAE